MIHRADHLDSFFLLTNEVARDTNLSDGAFRLLIFMLSCSDYFDFNTKGLAQCLNMTPSAVNVRVQELQKAGYISIKKQRDSNGRIESFVWDVFETPFPVLPNMDKTKHGENQIWKSPNMAKSIFGKSEHIRNTNSKEIPNKRNTKEKKATFKIPTIEEVRAYCQERKNNVDPEAFFDFYTSKGWKVGRDPMRDWKAAVRNWERRDKAEPKKKAETFDLEAWAEQKQKEQESANGLKTGSSDRE